MIIFGQRVTFTSIFAEQVMLLLLTKAPAPRSVPIAGALLKPANQSANVLPSQTADTIR